jgi:Tol biopolymer transport system component
VTRERCSRVVSVVVGLAGAALVAMSGSTAEARLDRPTDAAIVANGYSEAPSVSADGRFVAFDSEASNLVAGDTNDTWDVFVRDRRTKTTTLVSVSSSGAQADAASSHPSISANGRFVVFTSEATNLVPGETSGSMAVYVRDLEAGTTQLVNVDRKGQEMGPSDAGDISADGQIVVFTSWSDVVPGGTAQISNVFVRDRAAGTTQLVSVGTGGSRANGSSSEPQLSADGRLVVFSSYASNLVAGDANGKEDVFLRDRAAATTELVDLSSSGVQADNSAFRPSISADGRYVAFASIASNLAPGDVGNGAVFVRDRVSSLTERLDIGSGGTAPDGAGDVPRISADGHSIAFASWATNLIAGTPDACHDAGGKPVLCAKIYVGDQPAGTTERASVTSTGDLLTVPTGFPPAVSADGSVVAFTSASIGVDGSKQGVDIYVRDRTSGLTELISVARPSKPQAPATGRAPLVVYGTTGYRLAVVRADGSGRQLIGHTFSGQPSLSPDGRRIAFTAWTDPTGSYVGVMNVDGSSASGAPSSIGFDGATGRPRWSPDGRWIAFEGYDVYGSAGGIDGDYASLWVARADGSDPRRLMNSSGAGPGDGSLASQTGASWSWSPNSRSIAIEWPAEPHVFSSQGLFNVEIVDVRTGKVRMLTRGRQPAWSPDGRHVVFVRDTGIYVIGVDGRGLRAIVRVPVGEGDAAIDPRWSPDGKTIAYWTPNYDKPSLELVDATGHSPPRRLFQAAGNPIRPLWSRDSRSLLLTSDESGAWIVPVTPGSKPKRLATHTYEADWLG